MYAIGTTKGGGQCGLESEPAAITAMSNACSKGEMAVVKELIEKGANVNLKDKVRNFEQS